MKDLKQIPFYKVTLKRRKLAWLEAIEWLAYHVKKYKEASGTLAKNYLKSLIISDRSSIKFHQQSYFQWLNK